MKRALLPGARRTGWLVLGCLLAWPAFILAAVPRPEHPRPDALREQWLSLNGEWQFEIIRGYRYRAGTDSAP